MVIFGKFGQLWEDRKQVKWLSEKYGMRAKKHYFLTISFFSIKNNKKNKGLSDKSDLAEVLFEDNS